MRILFSVIITLISIVSFSQSVSWTAKRITAVHCQNESNSWYNFRKDFKLESVPDTAIAKIACDSKYWMWINGELVIFEGQLKRGPTPDDTYYDEVDITDYLRNGDNSIAILLWYFGKDGFSHSSSGQAGLVFQCDEIEINSDETWLSRVDKAFIHSGPPYPNYRLPESNIKFDARLGNFDWVTPEKKLSGFSPSKLIGEAESSPWNQLVKRPIPQWKNFGITDYENSGFIPPESTGDWIICELPYNCHVAPVLDVEAPAGLTIKIQTDNFDFVGEQSPSVRAEYITKEGKQHYESLGWMNGHVVKYLIPKGVKINSLQYRETGFDCEFSGFFNCNDEFYNTLWKKSLRTLYVTMRDTYMDCPDRERAQWWGDAVNESGEAFYALSPEAASLTKKGIPELINWQRTDGTLYSPIPEGNWDKELPGQMLASVGFYGFWNYYLNTGDRETIEQVYSGVRKYLDVWKFKQDGTLIERKGDWYWGDWGIKVDRQLLFNAWYYLALKGYLNMSETLNKHDEILRIQNEMKAFKAAFNAVFWDGNGYRTKDYEGDYDDRAQALAVVSGLADEQKYDALFKIFKTSYLASPYMEKYVLEALFIMDEPEYGLERMKKRFQQMVDSEYTTLFENFAYENGTITGTNNHAWSGGGLTLLSQYICGLEPIEPGWKTFQVKPQLGSLTFAEAGNETFAGKVAVKIEKEAMQYNINVEVPNGSKALVYIPDSYKNIKLNNTLIFKDNVLGESFVSYKSANGFNCFWVSAGTNQFLCNM